MTKGPADVARPPAGEDEFRLIADSAPASVWVSQLDRRRSFVNTAYVAFLGLSYEEALEFDWRQILHPDDAERLIAESEAGQKSLRTFTLEGRYRRWDGAWRWLRSTTQPRRNAAGEHIGFVGVAYDVTDAKQAELALREREEQLSAFINQSTAGFAQVDLEGRFTLVNDRFCEIAGWSREELLNRPMLEITHPDDRARNLPLFDQAVREGTPYAHEKRYIRKDGGVVWVNNAVSVVRRVNGQPYGVLAITTDVTTRRAAEARLRKSEESLRLAAESAGMASWECDIETLRGEWSPNRFDLLGIERSPDGTGSVQQWLDCVHPADRAMVESAVRRCLEQGTPYTIEYRIHRADDGSERWLQSHGSRIDYDDDRASRFVGISFDITTRKRSEERLRHNEESLRLAMAGYGMATWQLDLSTMEGTWSANRFDLLGLPRRPDLRGTVADWLACVHPDDRELAQTAAYRCFEQGIPYTIEYRILRADTGEERWLHSFGSRIGDGTDGSRRFVGVSFDITERKRNEEELRNSEMRFRTIFEQANDFLITATVEQIITSVNPAVLSTLGYTEEEVIGRHLSTFMDADQFRQSYRTLQQGLVAGGSTRLTVRVRAKDGRELLWEVNSRLSTDEQGRPNAIHAIARDMTDAKRAETHLRLLVDELNHRVKNTLAIVQGIAQQSFKADRDVASARRAFEGRLAALSEAHNLLTREHWGLVSMRQIIGDAVRPHGGTRRFSLDGPDLAIMPKTAISLALAIHELATNAVKHGALSNSEGHVSIAWARLRGDGPARLSLVWEERGGPPVEPPTRRGFGTRMIERGLAAELGGTVTIDFRREGVVCTVDAPLPEGAE